MNLLVIEDNTDLVDSLQHFLGAGSKLTGAVTGQEGLRQASEVKFDAIVLDLGLPDISGLDVCLGIRRQDIKTPLLVLSGTKDSNTKVALFEAGADDYVTKPFTVAELRARLLALLRRTSVKNENDSLYLLKVGDLKLDPMSRRVERSGKRIDLRRKEFDILEYLLRNRNKIVTRSMIMDNVWELNNISWDGTINVHIKRLRDQVDRPYKDKLIRTVYGLGYTISDKPD